MELKDYIHLFIGCKVKHAGLSNLRTLTPDWMAGLLENEKPLIFIKLILRPLSDMTDNDYKECGKYGFGGINLPQKLAHKTFAPETFIYLLKNRFDLFGLIEAGLAIDSTTLKHKIY